MSMGTTAAESPCNNRSPRGGGGGGDGPNSPQSRRTGSNTTAARNLSSPWANVVRGGGGGSVEREAVASTASAAAVAPPLPSVADVAPPDPSQESDFSPAKAFPPGNAVAEAPLETSDNAANGSGNAAKAAKKPAWNKPSNGVVESGPVMGAAWPALSESARAPAKPSDSLRAPSDGLTPVSIPVSTEPVTAASPLHKSASNNSTPNPNHVFPVRHKSSKRVGGGGTGPTNNGGFVPSPIETPHIAPDKSVAVVAEVSPDSSPIDPPHKNSSWEAGPRAPFVQQSHIGTDTHRGAFRRGNGGPRGDGNYHYGNRRDHERTNYEWNQPQGFNGRDVHVRQPRVVPRNFIRTPPPSPRPFVAPPPIRPYVGPMGFPDLPAAQYYIPVPPPESVRGGHFVAHPGPPPPIFYAPPPAQLQTMLIKQIDYYFSAENLCKDLYLRRHMDEQGWVPVSLIASFNRVKQLTNNVHFILDTLRMSAVVEVQGDKIRNRNDWKSWILLPSNQSPPLAGSQSPGTTQYDMLATSIQNVGLEDRTGKKINMNGPVASPTTYRDEGIGQTMKQTTSDQLISSRNFVRGDSS